MKQYRILEDITVTFTTIEDKTPYLITKKEADKNSFVIDVGTDCVWLVQAVGEFELTLKPREIVGLVRRGILDEIIDRR